MIQCIANLSRPTCLRTSKFEAFINNKIYFYIITQRPHFLRKCVQSLRSHRMPLYSGVSALHSIHFIIEEPSPHPFSPRTVDDSTDLVLDMFVSYSCHGPVYFHQVWTQSEQDEI